MIDFCEDFQVNGHFSVFHEISGIFRTFPQPPAIDGRTSANIRNWAMPPVGQFPSLDQRTMFVK